MKIKTKFLLAMFTFTIIPMILFSIYNINILKSQCDTEYLSNVSDTYMLKTNYIDKYLFQIENVSDNFLSNENVIKYCENTNDESAISYMQIIMKYMVNNNNYLENAFIIDNNNNIVASTNQSYFSLPKENYFNNLLNISRSNKGYSQFYDDNLFDENTYFLLSRPLYNKNNQILALYVQVFNMDMFNEFKNNNDHALNSIIIDTNMNIYDCNNFSFSNSVDGLTSTIMATIDKSKNFDFLPVEYDSNQYYANNLKVIGPNWHIVQYFNKSLMYDEYSSFESKIISCLIYILLFTVILIFFTVFRFTKPLDKIKDDLKEIEKGKSQKHIEISNTDELNSISKSLNIILDRCIDSETLYRTVVEMTNNIIFEINHINKTVFVSNNFEKQFSYRPPTNSLEDSFFKNCKLYKDDEEKYKNDFNMIFENREFVKGEYRFMNIYGDYTWFEVNFKQFFDEDGLLSKSIGIIVDIDRDKKSEESLLKRASYDALTQIYNRATFLRQLKTDFEYRLVKDTIDAVLFIDLDNFKYFNDEYSHACGDEVLQFVAETMKNVCTNGYCGRNGGDEFVICLKDLESHIAAGDCARNIIDILDKGFISKSTGNHFNIHVSIGIAFIGEDARGAENIIACADEAMYSVKRHGKSNFAYYSDIK